MPGRSGSRLFEGTAAAGIAFGAATSFVNAFGGPFLAQLLGMGWSWAALGTAVGWISRTRRFAIIGTTYTLLTAVLAYYAADLALGVYETLAPADLASLRTVTDWSGAFGDAAFWSAGALLVGPALGLVGRAIHRIDGRGLLAELVIPVMMVTNVALVALPLGRSQPSWELVAHGIIAVVGTLWIGWAVARRWPVAVES